MKLPLTYKVFEPVRDTQANHFDIFDAAGICVCDYMQEDEAKAIVTAVNQRAALVALAKRAQSELEAECICGDGHQCFSCEAKAALAAS